MNVWRVQPHRALSPEESNTRFNVNESNIGLMPLNTTSSRKLQFTEFFHTKRAVERAAFPRRPFRQSHSWQWSSLKDLIQHFRLVGAAVREIEGSLRTTTYQLFDHGQVTNLLSFKFCMYKMIYYYLPHMFIIALDEVTHPLFCLTPETFFGQVLNI